MKRFACVRKRAIKIVINSIPRQRIPAYLPIKQINGERGPLDLNPNGESLLILISRIENRLGSIVADKNRGSLPLPGERELFFSNVLLSTFVVSR